MNERITISEYRKIVADEEQAKRAEIIAEELSKRKKESIKKLTVTQWKIREQIQIVGTLIFIIMAFLSLLSSIIHPILFGGVIIFGIFAHIAYHSFPSD